MRTLRLMRLYLSRKHGLKQSFLMATGNLEKTMKLAEKLILCAVLASSTAMMVWIFVMALRMVNQ